MFTAVCRGRRVSDMVDRGERERGLGQRLTVVLFCFFDNGWHTQVFVFKLVLAFYTTVDA